VLVLRWSELGKSPHIVRLLNFLAQQGFDTQYVAVEAGKRPMSLAESVEFLSLCREDASNCSKVVTLLRAALNFRRVVGRWHPDLIYVIDSWTVPVILLAGAGKPHRLARTLVYHTFDWLEPNLHLWIHRWYERHFCLIADLCVNVDRSRARLMQTLYGLERMPLWVPNFPLREELPPPRDESLRSALLGNGGRILVVCASVASPARLHRELIEAFTLLPDEYVLLTFRGSGKYALECQTLARSPRLAGRITMLDPVPYWELGRYLACADIGVVLNDWRQSSGYWMANSGRLADYLAASVPVVTSDVPNLEALVYKWNLGSCCNPYEPGAIAEAIRRVVEGPPGLTERRQLVRRAFQDELHFERRGRLLASEIIRLWRERCFR
jgi:glycosyltransferase involved in cell wall biosynthesis